jgi:hypothetical protein
MYSRPFPLPDPLAAYTDCTCHFIIAVPSGFQPGSQFEQPERSVDGRDVHATHVMSRKRPREYIEYVQPLTRDRQALVIIS